MKWVLFSACVVFAVLRLTLPAHGVQTEDIFKDLAHLWVGGLFGAAIALKRNWLLWFLAGGLTAMEIFAAFFWR